MTGYWHPNKHDDDNNINASFATVSNVINGGLECG
jgi:hypothetical protein